METRPTVCLATCVKLKQLKRKVGCLTGGGTAPLREQTPPIRDVSQIVCVGFPNRLGAESSPFNKPEYKHLRLDIYRGIIDKPHLNVNTSLQFRIFLTLSAILWRSIFPALAVDRSSWFLTKQGSEANTNPDSACDNESWDTQVGNHRCHSVNPVSNNDRNDI